MQRFATLLCTLTLTAALGCSGERSEETGTACETREECSEGQSCEGGYCQGEAPSTGQGEANVRAEGNANGAPVMVEVTTGECSSMACEVSKGSTVTFRAPEAAGYRFAGWSGDPRCRGSQPVLVLENVEKDVLCTAEYVRRARVTGVAADEGTPPRAASTAAFAACAGGVCEVDVGSVVTLTASPREAKYLTHFSGAGCEDLSGDVVTVRASADIVCAAEYGVAVRLSASVAGADVSVSVSSDAAGARCAGSACTLTPGSEATLSAPQVEGYRFAGWTGDGVCVGDAPVLVIASITSDVACTASYVARRKVTGLAVGATPAPSIVATSPDVFAVCEGNVCEIDAGGTVQLLAPSVDEYRVAEWTGAGCTSESAGSALAANVQSDVTCTARYVRGTSVTGNVVGAPGQVVSASSSSPGAVCAAGVCNIDVGSTVTLTAPNLASHRFLGWTGDAGCASSARTITLADVQTSLTCNANFVARWTVTGAVNPAASGSVRAASSSAQASCSGAACLVNQGSSVSLDVTVNAGFRLRAWSGASCTTSAADPLVLDSIAENRTCTANLVQRFVVTGNVSGAPAGTVVTATSTASAPVAVCSGNACTVDSGSDVTLSAPNVANHRFTGWTGTGCSDADDDDNPRTLRMPSITAARTCSAGYVRRVVITYSSAPSGGSVAGAPAGSCSGTAANNCTITVDSGTNVDLTATPSTGFRFGSWSCSDANPATANVLDLDGVGASATCNATFIRRVTVTVAAAPGALGSVVIAPTGGTACAGTSCTVDAGTSVVITARESANARFRSWTGAQGCASNDASHSFVANQTTTCTAQFHALWARLHQQAGTDGGFGVQVLGNGQTRVTGTATTTLGGTAFTGARVDTILDDTGALVSDSADTALVVQSGDAFAGAGALDIAGTPDLYAVVGTLLSSPNRPFIAARGTSEWAVQFRTASNSVFQQVAHVAGSGFGAVGRTGDSGSERATVISFSEAGEQRFSRALCVAQNCGDPTCGTSRGAGITPRGDGFVVVSSGESVLFDRTTRQGMVSLLTATGTTSRELLFYDLATNGAPISMEPAGVLAMADGGYLIYGQRYLTTRDTDAMWIKLDRDLALVQQGALGNTGTNEAFTAAAETDEGGVVFVGNFTRSGRTDLDALFVRIDRAGSVETQAAWATGNGDGVSDIQPAPDGGYIVVGQRSYPAITFVQPPDHWLLRVDEQGDVPLNSSFEAIFSPNLPAIRTAVSLGAAPCNINVNGVPSLGGVSLVAGECTTTQSLLTP